MATSSETSIIANLHSSLLECSICLEEMTKPKILPCGHSFCLTCLNRTADRNNKKVLCAICRKKHRLPKFGVKGFPNNFTLVAFLDSMSISSKSNKNAGENHASTLEELKKIQAKALRDMQKIQDETKKELIKSTNAILEKQSLAFAKIRQDLIRQSNTTIDQIDHKISATVKAKEKHVVTVDKSILKDIQTIVEDMNVIIKK